MTDSMSPSPPAGDQTPGREPAARQAPSAMRRRPFLFVRRWFLMARTGIAMAFHDRSKSTGTLLGVIFAVVLVNQQLGTFLGLLQKNTMFVDNTSADLWIVPRGTQQLQAGSPLPISVLTSARTAPGVLWAEPLAFGTALMSRDDGGSEPVTLAGVRLPRAAGGPWNRVAGELDVLQAPDTVFFEDSQRENLGGLNLGSIRELNGQRIMVGGFTWGLLPFGPSYAFTEYDHARELLRIPSDQTSFVVVGLQPGQDPVNTAAALQQRLPDALVLRRTEFQARIRNYILTETAIGITFGTSAAFGIIVGFVIVALSMFSSVVDNIREFGTMKAVGARMSDLVVLIVVQAVTFALVGSSIGLFLVLNMAEGIRSPDLALVLPPALFAGSVAGMVLLCVTASMLALLRVRSVEPGMVFR